MFCVRKKLSFNPFALRKAKIEYNFGLSECNRVNPSLIYAAELSVVSYTQSLYTVFVCWH